MLQLETVETGSEDDYDGDTDDTDDSVCTRDDDDTTTVITMFPDYQSEDDINYPSHLRRTLSYITIFINFLF